MPALTGAIYIEHCLDDRICFYPEVKEDLILELDTDAIALAYQISKPHNRAEIANNLFL